MLTPVSGPDVAHVWPWVRVGLQKILKKTRDDWTPNDVLNEIQRGLAHLYLIDVRGARKGFVVLALWPTYHAGPRLFVRAMWAEPGSLRPHRDDLYDELQSLARQCGAVALRMTSPRHWELEGWTPKQTIYEMEVRTL